MAVRKIDRVRTRSRASGRPVQLRPIGVIRTSIKKRSDAPKQGSEGAPDAWLEMRPAAADGIDGLVPGADMIVILS